MLIYILLFLSIPLWNVVIKNKKQYVFLICLEFFLILSLRADNLGVDLENYKSAYEYISSLSFVDMISRLHLIRVADLIYPHSLESGYVVINWIASFLGLNFYGFLTVYAAFVSISLGYLVYKYSDLPWLSFTLFTSLSFFSYSFGILRQTLAMFVLVYSIKYILQRRPLHFLAIVLIAFTIHRIAILWVCFYVVSLIKVTRWRYIFSLCFLGAFLFVSPWLFKNVLSPILELLGKSSYTDAAFSLNNMFLLLLFIALYLFAIIDFKKLDDINRIALIGFLTAILINIIGMNNDGLARAMLLPLVFILILLPNMIHKYPDYGIRGVSKFLIYISAVAFFVYTNYDSKIIPYIPFWQAGI